MNFLTFQERELLYEQRLSHSLYVFNTVAFKRQFDSERNKIFSRIQVVLFLAERELLLRFCQKTSSYEKCITDWLTEEDLDYLIENRSDSHWFLQKLVDLLENNLFWYNNIEYNIYQYDQRIIMVLPYTTSSNYGEITLRMRVCK